MQDRLLILETSHRNGFVALASGTQILGFRLLEEARRHARDLVPKAKDLLAQHGLKARALTGVIVSRGPGSYTGLRVGIMSAKTLAYATGCALLAVDTFAAIARQAPAEALVVDVLADAQQDKVYAQRFGRHAAGAPMEPRSKLTIQPFAKWLNEVPETWVSGPGLEIFAGRLSPRAQAVASEHWLPRPESLLALGLERVQRGERDDLFAVEPLYLRPSAAEEKRFP